jgi:very-short-patch-repair endonuclease
LDSLYTYRAMPDISPTLALIYNNALPIAVAAIALALVTLAVLKLRRPWHTRIQPKPLLTPNETEFFHRLERALPFYRIFPQVAFAAFLTDDGKLSRQARWSLRAHFDRKIADFVICDRASLRIVALIELDDRTHVTSADRQRDAITKAAGYRTFRFQSRQKPSQAEISALFEHARAWTTSA